MSAIRGSRQLQDRCVSRIVEVLASHGKEAQFVPVPGDVPSMTTSFDHRGRLYTIEVYADGPVMLSGESLFEPFLAEEFENEDILVESFAGRLDRYLEGGDW